MRDLSLSGKTVILYGQWCQLIVSTWQTLTQLGADTAVLTNTANEPHRLADLINNEREINEQFGRAMTVTLEGDELTEAVSKVSESFGGIDVVVDNHNFGAEKSINQQSIQETLNKNFWPTINMFETVEPFFTGRKKGRYIIVVESELKQHISRAAVFSIAKQFQNQDIAIDYIIPELTECYLRSAFPDMAPTDVEKKLGRKITDAGKVANVIAFLAGNDSVSLNGQILEIT